MLLVVKVSAISGNLETWTNTNVDEELLGEIRRELLNVY